MCVATPLMGGLAVYAAFALTCYFVVPIRGPVVGVLVGGLGAVVVGVLDELLTLPPLTHLAGQVAVAVLAVVSGIGFVNHVSVPGPLTAPGLQLPARSASPSPSSGSWA